MSATTASGTEKTRAVVKEVVCLALEGEYAKVDEIMRTYGAEKTGVEDETAGHEFQMDEWDRKCAEAVENGAIIKGLKGTKNHRIQYYDSEGKLHREDGPAREDKDGYTMWKVHGEFHRVGAPAHVYPGHYKVYYQHGMMHREDGPAEITENGKKWYYLKGHPVPNLPTEYGYEWDLKCLQAVINGADITGNGVIVYTIKDGVMHNETGPAIERPDGTKEYWVNGTHLVTTTS